MVWQGYRALDMGIRMKAMSDFVLKARDTGSAVANALRGMMGFGAL
jgi:PII-like signaling protein